MQSLCLARGWVGAERRIGSLFAGRTCAVASEDRADALGAAVRGVQKGRQVLDENSGRVLGALGLATQEDLERLNRRLGRLRKRLRALLDNLE